MSFHSTEVQIIVYGILAYDAVQLKLPGKKVQRGKGTPYSHILPTFLAAAPYIQQTKSRVIH